MALVALKHHFGGRRSPASTQLSKDDRRSARRADALHDQFADPSRAVRWLGVSQVAH